MIGLFYHNYIRVASKIFSQPSALLHRVGQDIVGHDPVLGRGEVDRLLEEFHSGEEEK